MGIKGTGQERAAIVGFKEAGMKWDVLRKNQKFEKSERRYKNIRIGADLTRKERKENVKLREELTQKRERGGRWIINRNRVVQIREEENMHLRVEREEKHEGEESVVFLVINIQGLTKVKRTEVKEILETDGIV